MSNSSTLEAPEPTAAVEETGLTAEAPAVPDGAVPSAPADEAATTEPAAGQSTRPRGPDGRFIKADGTQASVAEQAVLEAAEATASQPPPTPPVARQPFVVRGDGKRLEMPGSVLNDKGDLAVTAEHVATYRQLIAEGLAHRGSWRQKEQQYQEQIRNAGAVEAARAEKYHKVAVALFDKATNPDWLAAAVADPREVQYLIRDLQLELKAADLGAPKAPEPTQPDPQVQDQQLRESMAGTLAEYIEELLETPQARAVFATEEDRKALTDELMGIGASFFEQQGTDWLLNEVPVEKAFQKELQLRQYAKAKAAADAKAKEFNEKRNQPPVAAPPVVSTRGPSASPGSGTHQYSPDKQQAREEWKRRQGVA